MDTSTRLTKIEQETIITFNEAEGDCTIFTYNKPLLNRLSQLSQKHKGLALVREGLGWGEYNCPKKWIKVIAPKDYSDEQREKMRERARERFGHSKQE